MEDLAKWRLQLRSADMPARAEAAEQLCLAGTAAAPAAVDLVHACEDDESVQNWAVAALEELGPPPLDAVPALRAAVSSAHPLVAYWAATLLGRLGSQAAAAVNDLAQALSQSNDPGVQERMAWALGKIGPATPQAQHALQQARDSGEPRLAALAEAALTPSHPG